MLDINTDDQSSVSILRIDQAEFRRLAENFKKEIYGNPVTPSMDAGLKLIDYIKAQFIHANEERLALAAEVDGKDVLTEIELRQIALSHATGDGCGPLETVERAKQYLAFLKGAA